MCRMDPTYMRNSDPTVGPWIGNKKLMSYEQVEN